MTMQASDALRALQQITTEEQRSEAADSLAVEVMTLLMAIDDRASAGDMDDEEPAAGWLMLDTMRRLLDEVELRMIEALVDGRTLQEAAELTGGRYSGKGSMHRRRKVLSDTTNRRTLTMDYKRGAAVAKPKPGAPLLEQTTVLVCGAEWGVCPEHGNTLASSGGTTRCKTTDCGRTWNYDRVQHQCEEPPTYTVTDPSGGVGQMCTAHARDARFRIEGVKIKPL